jgi:hypothetical protein
MSYILDNTLGYPDWGLYWFPWSLTSKREVSLSSKSLITLYSSFYKLYVLRLLRKKNIKVKLSIPLRHVGAKVERKSYSFLTSALDRVSDQCHAPAALYPREWIHVTHCTGDWVSLRTGLDTETKGKVLCLCQGSNSGRAVCSQTLYWLSYPTE